MESGERIVVGVNRFVEDEQPAAPPHRHDPSVGTDRARLLADWRAQRDRPRCEAALARIERVARGTDNLMPPILEALVAHATLGEVCDVLRGVFGVHRAGDHA